mmetsp:Transcript_64264/g.170247  ORF Transcript_64264/g.170247 Transcript_64264/m.170247 type:complete len:183 (-) Transcript_64264:280-828(-)
MLPAFVTSSIGRLAVTEDESASDVGDRQRSFVTCNAAQCPITPWDDVHAVIASAQEAMRLNDHVKQVSLTPGPMGGATGLVAEVRGGVDKGSSALTAAKAALLRAAEKSETVYVMGYAANPFRDDRDTGFQCCMGHLPTSLRGNGCWDNVQKGFCPRRSSCRWCHFDGPDLLTVVVQLKASA